MKSEKMTVLGMVGSAISGVVLSAAIILLPIQGAFAGDAAPQTSAKAPAKKAAHKKAAHKKAVKAGKKHGPSAFWKKVQTALIAKGAKIKADGYWGSLSKKALMNFQKANKLKATGKLDKATKKALGL